ncbi:MAG: NAD(+)/NADH kinase [Candidatus Competibacterales bacterium]|nr:NAD(+)/NADH kinase [Candidatus Competibacterales bacterium]
MSLVGIIANPVSARDIRRLVANASGLQISDRANIVLRVLASLGATGIRRVLMMPDKGGISGLLTRALVRERNLDRQPWPEVEFLDMPVSGTVHDSFRAAARMAEVGVRAIVVLGGDGTSRAVARYCGHTPIAGLSTGTNNAFPELREPTITGLAVGLYATGAIAADEALRPNKVLEIEVNDGDQTDLALVDVAVTCERYVGARALWRTDNFRELFVTFAAPEAIGMSSIAGLLDPVGRDEAAGLHVRLSAPGEARQVLTAPIGPGMVSPVGIAGHQRLQPDHPYPLATAAGSIALDGEREIEFAPTDRVTVRLRTDRLFTVDVPRVMRAAARERLLCRVTSGGA